MDEWTDGNPVGRMQISAFPRHFEVNHVRRRGEERLFRGGERQRKERECGEEEHPVSTSATHYWILLSFST